MSFIETIYVHSLFHTRLWVVKHSCNFVKKKKKKKVVKACQATSKIKVILIQQTTILEKLCSLPPKLKKPETLPNLAELLSMCSDTSDTQKSSGLVLRGLLILDRKNNTWLIMGLFKR